MAECSKCGRLVSAPCKQSSVLELYREVRNAAPHAKVLCGLCLDVAWEEFLGWRRRYEEIVASGVHPKMASRIILQEIEAAEGPPEVLEA